MNAAYQIYGQAPALGFIPHANGDGIPVRGDMIIHNFEPGFPAGHVSIVDYVANGKVYVVEQNANPTGMYSYNPLRVDALPPWIPCNSRVRACSQQQPHPAPAAASTDEILRHCW